MDLTIEQRVENGAALLDERKPGWVDLIDLEKLNVKSLAGCPIGQLYGEFMAGYEALGFDAYKPRHGGNHYGFDGSFQDFDYLTAAWKDLIENRRLNAQFNLPGTEA